MCYVISIKNWQKVKLRCLRDDFFIPLLTQTRKSVVTEGVAPVDEFRPGMWEQIIAVNLTAAFHTTRTALPLMKANGWGRIINIASVHGLIASPFKSAYIAARHGMVGLTRTVALKTAEQGITCNAICPG